MVHGTTSRPLVQISADDPSLTGCAGLVLSGELVHRLGLVQRLDAAINAVREFKQRRRGLSTGELLVSLAEMIMVGGSHLAHLEVLRQDVAGAQLRAVAEVLRILAKSATQSGRNRPVILEETGHPAGPGLRAGGATTIQL